MIWLITLWEKIDHKIVDSLSGTLFWWVGGIVRHQITWLQRGDHAHFLAKTEPNFCSFQFFCMNYNVKLNVTIWFFYYGKIWPPNSWIFQVIFGIFRWGPNKIEKIRPYNISVFYIYPFFCFSPSWILPVDVR